MSKKTIISRWVLVFLWMVLIFNFSSKPASISNNESLKVTEKFAKVTVKDFVTKPQTVQQSIVNNLNPLIRKYAHTFLYAVLAFLLMFAFSGHRFGRLKCTIYSAAVTLLYAAFDECHQIFVKGRGPLFSDVGLDFASGFLGILIFLGITFLIKRIKKRIIHMKI